ncbi:MAG TPA: hypothetical protein DCP08_09615 [Chloroflexi bacterium]|nr:hypothetical protein [Chloroflexota bacterium]
MSSRLYESYRLASLLTQGFERALLPERWRNVLLSASGPVGAILFTLPLFAFPYTDVSGPLIPGFAGLWLLLECGIYTEKGRKGS